jgi:methanogenic corrinoid protein MtbC1
VMLRGAGFEVRDMGINVPAQQIVREVVQYKPDILALSALLTSTMPEMRKVIDKLEEMQLHNQTKVIVGGAPVNQRFANIIGADGYAPNAAEAVTLARHLL